MQDKMQSQIREELRKLVQIHVDGRMTLYECVDRIREVFMYASGLDAGGIRFVASELPQEMLDQIMNDVDTAPRTGEEWARFRIMRGPGVYRPMSYSESERILADSQATYYRFVIAWREAFEAE